MKASTVAALLSADFDGIIHPPLPQFPTPDGNGDAEAPRLWRSADLNRLHELELAVPYRRREDHLWLYRLTEKGWEMAVKTAAVIATVEKELAA